MAQLFLWTKIRTRQWLVLGASAFNVCVGVFCVPNATILFVYIHAKIKMSFFWNAKIGIFCKSSKKGPLSEACTQPYSFDGRIKLIMCQIRHELSVTIHKIFTRWKKTSDGEIMCLILLKLHKKFSLHWKSIHFQNSNKNATHSVSDHHVVIPIKFAFKQFSIRDTKTK